ncbi:MAG: ATP-dependent Clp protease ATP-binding subunit [Oscillospiraceae bacterium]|nr:ATP-dependent Clp protease ATP-binding subunit [Oscillospiraceae bacterium]
MLCSFCKKRLATVFVAKNSSSSTAQGLCLVCARNMGIKPVDEMMEKMGFSESDMNEAMEQLTGLIPSSTGMDAQTTDVQDSVGECSSALPISFLPQVFPPGFNVFSQKEIGQKKGKKNSKKKYLNAYCQNLTEKARSFEIDAVLKREDELNRVIQILCRRTKNNPCLIGEPGVGKTAIAECLAMRIAQGNIHIKMKNKEVYLLDLTALVAGTQFRGQFESRVKGLVEEIESLQDIILVIDEIHNLIGSCDSDGSGSPMNAANILKPALSRGRVQVIGATTFKEYRKYIEKDSALERRFQPIIVKEPSVENTIEILMGIKSYYEKFHNVVVDSDIVKDIVKLSQRYIADRFLPDKAIDLLDESCTLTSLKNESASKLEEIKIELEKFKASKKTFMEEVENTKNNESHYEDLAKINCEIARLEKESTEILSDPNFLPHVTHENVTEVVELWTGINSSKIQKNELAKFANLEDRLGEKIIGQQEGIKAIADSIRRNRVKVASKARPSSFIFAGSTGVGKTALVKVLLNELFDSSGKLIRLDMSEFMEKHSVSRMVGSPPGYVGYDEAGQLTEKVRRQPYSILLLDEIEKAHPDVMNILLQILDEGRITDSHGRLVNFENTIIIMTSNAGSEKKEGALGFEKNHYQVTKNKVMESLREFLRPEFLGRIDDVIVFNELCLSDFEKIARIMIDDYVKSLKERELIFDYDDKILKYLSKKSVGKKSGARELRNLIRKEIEDKIANIIIETQEKVKNIFAKISEDEDSIDFVFS